MLIYKKQTSLLLPKDNCEKLLIYSFGKKSKVEKSEDIEMIRFLELNVPIKMIKLSKGSIAVDVISDIKKVEKSLKKNERKN